MARPAPVHRIENYLGFPAGSLRCRPCPPRLRPGTPVRRRVAQRPAGRVPSPRRPLPRGQSGGRDRGLLLRPRDRPKASVRQLDLPGITPLTGCGVFYGAAMTEAATYRGQAGRGRRWRQLCWPRRAVLLKVLEPRHDACPRRLPRQGNVAVPYRSHRRSPEYRCSHRVAAVAAVSGSDHLESVEVVSGSNGDEKRRLRAGRHVHLHRQHATHGHASAGLVELDENGYILTGPDLPADGTAAHAAGYSSATHSHSRPMCLASSPSATCGPVRESGSRPPSAKVPAVSESSTTTLRQSELFYPNTNKDLGPLTARPIRRRPSGEGRP